LVLKRDLSVFTIHLISLNLLVGSFTLGNAVRQRALPNAGLTVLGHHTALTLIILLSEMLKFSQIFSLKKIKLWRKILNLQEYSIHQNENFKINKLFDRHVLKLPWIVDNCLL
jgi:hypothetical protein